MSERILHLQHVKVGFDTIDIPACTERGVAVMVVNGANDLSVAEHAMMLMLGVARRAVDARERDSIAEGITEADQSENVETPFVGFYSRWRNYDTRDPTNTYCVTARESYRSLWESINGPCSWDLNPWVWVIEFKEVNK